MMDKEVSDKVDKTLASMFEIIEDCERLGLEDKSVVKAALKLFDFWKDNGNPALTFQRCTRQQD